MKSLKLKQIKTINTANTIKEDLPLILDSEGNEVSEGDYLYMSFIKDSEINKKVKLSYMIAVKVTKIGYDSLKGSYAFRGEQMTVECSSKAIARKAVLMNRVIKKRKKLKIMNDKEEII